MASSEKTTRGLNKWAEGDKPSMADFNADNQRLEELLGRLEDKLVSKTQISTMIQEALKPYYSLKGDNRTELPEGADLNDYTQTGMVYVANGNEKVATMKNTPFGNNSFTMTVEPALTNSAYIIQTAKVFSNGTILSRTYTAFGSKTWSDWVTR